MEEGQETEGKWWEGELQREDVAADREGSQVISAADMANVQR